LDLDQPAFDATTTALLVDPAVVCEPVSDGVTRGLEGLPNARGESGDD
jgi:hypothetical protein